MRCCCSAHRAHSGHRTQNHNLPKTNNARRWLYVPSLTSRRGSSRTGSSQKRESRPDPGLPLFRVRGVCDQVGQVEMRLQTAKSENGPPVAEGRGTHHGAPSLFCMMVQVNSNQEVATLGPSMFLSNPPRLFAMVEGTPSAARDKREKILQPRRLDHEIDCLLAIKKVAASHAYPSCVLDFQCIQKWAVARQYLSSG